MTVASGNWFFAYGPAFGASQTTFRGDSQPCPMCRLQLGLAVSRAPQCRERDAQIGAGGSAARPVRHLRTSRFDAGRKRRIARQRGSFLRFPVPGQVSCLAAQAKLYGLDAMSHSSLELLYTHLGPRVGIQCRSSITMAAPVSP